MSVAEPPPDPVAAVAEEVRFYVDESALGLGKTLAAARKDVIHIGHPLIPECPVGTIDPVWMPIVAAKGLVVIIRDKLRAQEAEREAIREHGLRVFWLGGKKDLSTWGWLGQMMRFWDRIESIIDSRPDGPWLYMITGRGLDEVNLHATEKAQTNSQARRE
jgi:hypothetical protein